MSLLMSKLQTRLSYQLNHKTKKNVITEILCYQ